MTLVFIFSPFKRLGRPLVDFIFIPNSESQLYTLLITKDTWIYFIVAFLNQHKPISVFYISRVPYLPCPLLSFPDGFIQYPSLLWVWTGYFGDAFLGRSPQRLALLSYCPMFCSFMLVIHFLCFIMQPIYERRTVSQFTPGLYYPYPSAFIGSSVKVNV